MEKLRWRVIATFLLCLGLLFGLFPGAAHADDEGFDWNRSHNHVYVTNDKDGGTKTKSRVNITRNTDDTIDNQNYAVAYGTCVGCRTVAVAVQVVVHTGPPGPVAPENVAVAVNDECEACETIAFARQYVVSAKPGFNFSDGAEDRIEEISGAIQRQSKSGDGAFEMGQKLDALYEELKAAVRADIDRAGMDGDQPDEENREFDDD